jgi:RNA polymerase sigma-70 factor (ECF subfamily)
MEKQKTEAEILNGLKQGDEESYKQLFFTYFEPLTYYANKYLGDLDSAQDVVQEVFTYLFENKENLLISESLKSFLYKSVGNRSLNILKHEDVKNRNHALIKQQGSEFGDDDLIETAELEARILRLLDELPPACSQIFKMSRLEHKSNQEIADALDISKRTVETQISNALKVLRSALKIMLIEIILKNFE